MKSLIPVLIFAGTVSCPKPVPNPTPTPSPIPTATPTPSPVPNLACTFPQGVPDADFKEVPNPLHFASIVDQVISKHTNCAIGSDCILGQSDPQFYLQQIIDWVIQDGLCAGQHRNGETDEISVSDTCQAGTTWENYHVVNFGNTTRRVAWNPGSARSGWIVNKSCQDTGPNPIPTPKPTPKPPNPSCGVGSGRPPCPGEETCNCPPSLDKINLAVRDQAAWIVDATPQTCNKDWLNENGFPGRNCGPLGQEGSTCRPICEGKYNYTWTLNGSLCGNGSSACFPNGDPPNPLQLRVPKPASGTVKITASNGVSAEGVLQ